MNPVLGPITKSNNSLIKTLEDQTPALTGLSPNKQLEQIQSIHSLTSTDSPDILGTSEKPRLLCYHDPKSPDNIQSLIKQYTVIIERYKRVEKEITKAFSSGPITYSMLSKKSSLEAALISALKNRGDLYARALQWNFAAEDYNAVLKIDKYHPYALAGSANADERRGHSQLALTKLKLALNTIPNDPTIHYYLACSYDRLDDVSNAIEHYKLARKFGELDNKELNLALADCLTLEGHLEEASSEYEDILDTEPEDYLSRMKYGHVLYDMNKLWEAKAQYNLAAEGNSDFEPLWHLGKTYKRIGLDEDALEQFDKAIALKPSTKMLKLVLVDAALTAAKNFNTASYKKYLGALKKLDPNSNELVLVNAIFQFYDDKIENAHKALESLNLYVLKNPEDDQGYYHRGVVLNHLGRYKDAAKDFKKVLQNDPQNYDSLFELAVAFESLNQVQEAIDELEKCSLFVDLFDTNDINRDTGNMLKVFIRQAHLYSRLGKSDKALRMLKKILKLDIKDPDHHIAMGKYYFDNRDYIKAFPYFVTAHQLDKSLEKPLYFMTHCKKNMGQQTEALECAKKLHILSPNEEGYTLLFLQLKKEVQAQTTPAPTELSTPKKKSKHKPKPSSSREKDLNASPAPISANPLFSVVEMQSMNDKEERIHRDTLQAEKKQKILVEQQKIEKLQRAGTSRFKKDVNNIQAGNSHRKKQTLETPFSKMKAKLNAQISAEKNDIENELSDGNVLDDFLPNVVPLSVQLAKNSFPIPQAKQFDPTLLRPGEIYIKERTEEKVASPLKPLKTKKTDEDLKILPIENAHHVRLTEALGALKQIDWICQQADLVSKETNFVSDRQHLRNLMPFFALLDHLRILINCLDSSEKSSVGEDKNFEGMRNKVLISTKRIDILRKDLLLHYTDINQETLKLFCQSLLATSLKARLETITTLHAWPLYPEAISIDHLELVAPEAKFDRTTDEKRCRLIGRQLTFLSDIQCFEEPTASKLEHDLLLEMSIRMSLKILFDSSKKLERPALKKLLIGNVNLAWLLEPCKNGLSCDLLLSSCQRSKTALCEFMKEMEQINKL